MSNASASDSIKYYHHFDVTKNDRLYQIVVEGRADDAKKELFETFGFDTVKFLKTSSARCEDYHGNRRIGNCIVRGFWEKARQVMKNGGFK